MNVMGISVYFIVILVGVLLGLVVGLSILSFVQNRKEKKKYKRVMQEALGFEDGVKKIRKRKEKEEKCLKTPTPISPPAVSQPVMKN